MMNFDLRLSPLGRALTRAFSASAFGCLALSAHAQTGPELESVLVIGEQTPLDATNTPFELIDRAELSRDSSTTLGEALRYRPGLSATGFGPNSSRPIVRGQDADRIKILRNSAATLDASALSFDHALPIDPFSIRQVEILRGPATLAYGGNAAGGAINLVDNRIPRQAINGFEGEFNGVYGGANNQIGSGLQLGAGLGGGVSVRLDGFRRQTEDLRTPTFTDPDGNRSDRVRNSASVSHGAAIGASIQTGRGYLGVSAEQLDNDYGVPSEEDLLIALRNERYALEGEHQFDSSLVQKARFRFARTRYQHQEFEDGAAETLFQNRGNDGRLELALQPFNLGAYAVKTQTGVQFERSNFLADGDEAFVPPTQTRQLGTYVIFGLNHQGAKSGKWELGLRSDSVRVESASTGGSPAAGPIDEADAGPLGNPGASRKFNPQSVSLGYSLPVGQSWMLGSTLSRIERAPSSFELFADGLHKATGAYERGNTTLEEEKATHLEISADWEAGHTRMGLQVFQTRYDNYIALLGRGELFDAGGAEESPIFDFVAVPARFRGLEFSAQTQLQLGQIAITPALQYDLVRAVRRDGGGNLPRISPQRVRLTAQLATQGWLITPELVVVGANKTSTDDPQRVKGHELLNLRVAKPVKLNTISGELFARLDNLTDELAFSATTIDTVRGFSPLAGRSITVGARFNF